MGMRTFILCTLLAASVAGCVTQTGKRPPYVGPTQSMRQVVEEINRNNASIRTLRTAHTFEALLYDDKGKSHAFSGDGYLLFRKPEELLLTAGGVIGKFFEVGSNADRYWFTVYPDEVSTQWWGDKANFTPEAARQIPIRPDLLLEVLGVLDIDTNFKSPPVPVMRFNNDEHAYMFLWNVPLPDRWVAQKEVWYDRETKLPKLVLLFDTNGRIILRAYLSDHKTIEGASGKIASRFDLYFPESKSHLTFQLKDIRDKFQKGRVSIPNDASFEFPEDPGVKKRVEIK